MERRMIDIASDGVYLHCRRGHMEIQKKSDTEPIHVPFDEIEAVLVHARHAGYSHGLMVRLSEENIPLVICNKNHMPLSWLWPVSANYEATSRTSAQLGIKAGQKRRLWARLVRAKIKAQAGVLHASGSGAEGLEAMAGRVRSGDPDNLEAQAAQRYWPRLFGRDFRRRPAGGAPNGLLNYGYTILRAATARSILGAGLHPSVGLFHKNQYNDFCLADDLMEPFRPHVDRAVYGLVSAGETDVTDDGKAALVAILSDQVEGPDGFHSLSRALEKLALSLVDAFREGHTRLYLPVARAKDLF